MIPPKIKTEDLLLSFTKKCETPIKQTHTKSQETLEFEQLTKPVELFSFKIPFPIEESWMVGLTSLEIYNSIFNITEKSNKFELLQILLMSFHLHI